MQEQKNQGAQGEYAGSSVGCFLWEEDKTNIELYSVPETHKQMKMENVFAQKIIFSCQWLMIKGVWVVLKHIHLPHHHCLFLLLYYLTAFIFGISRISKYFINCGPANQGCLFGFFIKLHHNFHRQTTDFQGLLSIQQIFI